MKNIWFLTLLLTMTMSTLTACQQPVSNDPLRYDFTLESTGEIVGGKQTSLKDPLTFSNFLLVSKWTNQEFRPENLAPVCTVSALSRHTLVTAAHCISPGNEKDYYLQIVNLRGKKSYIKISDYKIHPDYQNRKSIQADLAVLITQISLPSSARFLRIADPEHDLNLNGSLATLGGYGKTIGTRAPRTEPASLKHISRKISDYDKSKAVFLLDQTDGLGACNGDSGGVVYVLIRGKSYAVGSISRTQHAINNIPEDKSICDGMIVTVNLQYFQKWLYQSSAELLKARALSFIK